MTSPCRSRSSSRSYLPTLLALLALWFTALTSTSVQADPIRYKGFFFQGFVDAGFAYQKTVEPSNDTMTWRINEIELAIQHDFSSKIGVRVAINYLRSTPNYSGTALLDSLIQEATLNLNLPITSTWSFYANMGRFFAPQGWDALNTVDRYQPSASYLNNATPNTFMGLKIGFKNSWIDVYSYLSNGWDIVEEVDIQPTVGGGATFTVGPATIGLSVTNGREPSAVRSQFQDERTTMLDLQLTLNFLNNTLIVGAEGTVFLHPADRLWYGWLFLVHYQPIKWIGATLRTSRFGDPNALATSGVTQDEVSFALLSRPWTPVVFMAEYRIDLQDGVLVTHTVEVKGIYRF